MFCIGMQELIIIAIIASGRGPPRASRPGESLGKGFSEFRKAARTCPKE
jgi:Sec-independent protein translocase protein TatA